MHGAGVEPAQREAGGLQPLGLTHDQAHAKGEQGDSNPPLPGPQPGVLPLHHEHHGVPLRGTRSTEQESNLPRAPCEGAALPMSYRSFVPWPESNPCLPDRHTARVSYRCGAPGPIRTGDPTVRNRVRYPAAPQELEGKCRILII